MFNLFVRFMLYENNNKYPLNEDNDIFLFINKSIRGMCNCTRTLLRAENDEMFYLLIPTYLALKGL